MAIPITWQLQVQGAENVKGRLAELNSQFERGEITTEQYASGLRSVNRDARVLSNTMTIQKNIFLSTHPVLNNLSRAMSIFGSVNRAVMSGLNTINIAMIALNTNTAGMAQATADVAQAQREYDEAVLKFGPDSKQAIEALDELRIAQARLGEETQNRANQITSSWFAVGTAISGIVTSIVLTLPKILPFLAGFGKTISGIFGEILGFFGGAGTLGPLFLAPFLDLIPGMKDAQEQFGNLMRKFFREDVPGFILAGQIVLTSFAVWFTNWWGWLSKTVIESSPKIISGFRVFYKGIIDLTNAFGKLLIGGINSIVAAVISALNTLIAAYNAVAIVLGQKTIKPIQFKPIEFKPIDTSGFTNKEESGIIPGAGLRPGISGKGAEKAAQNNVYITVQGSILTENDFKKIIDKWLKNDLRSVGF